MFQLIKERIANCFARLIGYSAFPDWTPSPRPGEFILDLPAYVQVDSYSCGVTAGFQVVKYHHPRASFSDFYDAVNPNEKTGTSGTRLVKTLREFDVSVGTRAVLNPTSIKRSLDNGWPVIAVMRQPRATYHHWITLYGYSDSHVMVANNGFLWFYRRRMEWSRFLSMWEPKGRGLVCK